MLKQENLHNAIFVFITLDIDISRLFSRTRRSEMFFKIGIPKNFAKFTGKHLRHFLFFNKVARPQVCIFIKKEILAQVFSYEFCEIFKNNFFYRTLPVAASDFP